VSQHYLDVICPNCSELLSIPVRIGTVYIQPKSVVLHNIDAKVPHQCRRPGVERPVPTEDGASDG